MKEINELLEITKKLKEKYDRNFTLDGNLVGDIGEVLAAEKYGLELFKKNTHVHDAFELSTKRLIQIKSSFSNTSYFPCNNVPDFFLAIQILNDGTIEELFNGKGSFIVTNYIKKRGLKANGRYLYTLSGEILRKINKDVPTQDKIKEV